MRRARRAPLRSRGPRVDLAHERERAAQLRRGFWVETLDELGPALDAAFACGKPACVNVKIARSDFRKGAISV